MPMTKAHQCTCKHILITVYICIDTEGHQCDMVFMFADISRGDEST